MKYKVGIIGCGAILSRHIEAINKNSISYELVALCDNNKKKLDMSVKKYKATGFENYKLMLDSMNKDMNLVVIATPNFLHYQQAIDSLNKGYDVIIEKPVTFESAKILSITEIAKKKNRNAYVVLQVRYNPTISVVKSVLAKKLLGDIRSVTLIQRWQRPFEYFHSWRADKNMGGRTLYEVGIHYLDILQYLFGLPEVIATTTFKHKHKAIKFEDTVFSIFKINSEISGSLEVTVAAEPSNLECSISILGSKGFLKIGGKALDKIDEAKFLNSSIFKEFNSIKKNHKDSIEPNSYGTHQGSCPNHPDLYREIALGNGIPVSEAFNSIKFIEDIYGKEVI